MADRTSRWGVAVILLAGWSLFSYGLLGQPVAEWSAFLIAAPPALLLLLFVAWRLRDRWWPPLVRELEAHTDALDAIPVADIGRWIALAAGLGLYAELMMIRLHASWFQLFAYFKNVSLLSCFLGLGIGYTLGARRPLLTPLVLPGLAIQALALNVVRLSGVATAMQNPVSEELAFGLQAGAAARLLAVYGFIITVFSLNALCFVPLGQLASRLMARQAKLVAYGWNLAGSLLGILLFSFMAFVWAPPAVWLMGAALMVLVVLWKRAASLLPSAIAAAVAIAAISVPGSPTDLEVFSPYQQLTLAIHRAAPPELQVNHVYHQRVLPLDSASVSADPRLVRWRDHYDLPYRFRPAPGRVLVVGAGTGNDVAAAVRAGAAHVDAVEIDPAILEFGRLLHPESPYQAPTVTAHVADARAFIRHAPGQYDLIVYGLLDSHTLLSSKAGVRLDSYVYTVEAFREARARLTDDGLISLTFSLIKPALGRKLYLMLTDAFDGERPVVYSTEYDEGFTFLVGPRLAERPLPVRPGLRDVTADFSGSREPVSLSTDDWPFFYMPLRKYPASYLVMIATLLGISLVFVRQTVPGSGTGLSAPCFFLGAGFMLIETKGITELALVYGSTWTVIAIVIAGILVMAFCANLIVWRVGAPPPVITYGLLLASIAAGLLLTSARLAGLPPWLGGALLTAALTVPLFFSGFAFSTELARAPSVAVALSSNLLGAMLGGFLEYNSMYFGFRSLYFLALAMYALAFFFTTRITPADASAGSA